jgi:hypothetical protein
VPAEATAKSVSSALRATLLTSANSAGGFGYYAGRTSRIEPTCWALLALGPRATGYEPELHWRFLRACQRASAFLVEDPALPINFGFNAVAAVTMLREPAMRSDPGLRGLLDALVKQSGLQIAQSPHFRQDNSLRGWAWIESTFSWVEPTCWAVLALKRGLAAGIAPAGASARIEEAERMLIDRACRDGGWNYGNSNALGKELFPYIQVSALALLALQNRRDVDAVTRGVRYVQDHWTSEVSALSVALTSICLRRFGRPTEKIEETLLARSAIASSLGNIHAMATALYALAANDDAFTL